MYYVNTFDTIVCLFGVGWSVSRSSSKLLFLCSKKKNYPLKIHTVKPCLMDTPQQ